MEAASMRRRTPWAHSAKVDWGTVATWLFGFGIVIYLGLKGGGYGPLVHDRVGIALWWVLLAGVLAGALPRGRLGRTAWIALGLLAAFAAWAALSLIWTESVDNTSADLARVAGYVAVFALALFARGRDDARLAVGAVAAGIVCVSFVALLSRLHPAWFPEATQTARFVNDSRERLSYPIDYWNGLAALIAIGIPLLLQITADAKSIVLRALAAAALPMLALTAFLTLSRGGSAAAIVGLAVFLVVAPDRLPKLLTLLVAAAGGALLIAADSGRDAFQHGLVNGLAESQGNQMLLIVLAVCVAVGGAQAGICLGLQRGLRPRWTRVPRRRARDALVAGLLVLLIAAVAFNAPGHASDAWNEFRQGGQAGSGSGRLTSAAGESRYELWVSALHENASRPLTGTGSGSFEFWWARNGGPEAVRDTHSLYLQTLGELGIVGLVLLAAFLLLVLAVGARRAWTAEGRHRSALAAALAGCAAFCFAAGFDWLWQIPVLPIAALLLGSTLVSAGTGKRSVEASLKPLLRLALAGTAIIAIVAIAIPLASTDLLRQSEADVREGDMSAALDDARSAENVQPAAAEPRLQQALVLESQGDLSDASTEATAATELESTNWRNWLVLSRIEAERGHAAAAVRSYRRARSLNPHSPLFDR